MIEILKISNYHQFDGIKVTKEQFQKLYDVLDTIGKYHFTARVKEDGQIVYYSSHE